MYLEFFANVRSCSCLLVLLFFLCGILVFPVFSSAVRNSVELMSIDTLDTVHRNQRFPFRLSIPVVLEFVFETFMPSVCFYLLLGKRLCYWFLFYILISVILYFVWPWKAIILIFIASPGSKSLLKLRTWLSSYCTTKNLRYAMLSLCWLLDWI